LRCVFFGFSGGRLKHWVFVDCVERVDRSHFRVRSFLRHLSSTARRSDSESVADADSLCVKILGPRYPREPAWRDRILRARRSV
jgi:hypothetical protein